MVFSVSCGFVDRRLRHDNNTIHEITLNATKTLSFRVGSIVLPGKRISNNSALVQFANKLGTQATWRKKCPLQNRER